MATPHNFSQKSLPPSSRYRSSQTLALYTKSRSSLDQSLYRQKCINGANCSTSIFCLKIEWFFGELVMLGNSRHWGGSIDQKHRRSMGRRMVEAHLGLACL